MIIKYRGQLYKRVDAGEQKIAEVLKRKLQAEAVKAGADIDITGSINEKTGGELSVWLNFNGPVDKAKRLASQMGRSMKQAVKSLDSLPFFSKRYFIDANISMASGSGSRRLIGKVTVEPSQGWSANSNSSILQKVGLGSNERRGLPKQQSESWKDQTGAYAANSAANSLKLDPKLVEYAGQLGRLDSSLARELKAFYRKSHELASKCSGLYKKHNQY